MASRRARKRWRRKSGAVATVPQGKPPGGWGSGARLRGADLRMVRQAVAEGWRASPEACLRVVTDLMAAASSTDTRLAIGAGRLLAWIQSQGGRTLKPGAGSTEAGGIP